jgi:hypothetical protein
MAVLARYGGSLTARMPADVKTGFLITVTHIVVLYIYRLVNDGGNMISIAERLS